METRSKRKSNSFKFQKTKTQRLNIDFIQNQSTLVGSYLNLMEKQKVVVAVLRIKNGENSRLIPICFKVEENQLPNNLQLLQIHANNMIEANIPGCKPFLAMIVSIGDDSKELFEGYSIFVAHCKEKKVSNLENKINNWLNVEGVKIAKSSSKGLLAIEEEDFEMLMSKVRTIRTRSKSAIPTKPQSDVAVIDLIESSPPEQKPEFGFGLNSSLQKIKELNQNQLTPGQIQIVFAEIIKLLETIVQSSTIYQDSMEVEPIQHEKSSGFSEIRFIPEKDKTHEVANTTMVEGILPILTKKYKKSFSACSKNQSEFEPSTILTNIIRYAFPKHWLIGVTLRGAGGKKSLVSVWNYRNPLVDPCVGAFENGLGESRLRALIDHVVRKSNKQSYDKATEKLLITVLSKALHYARSKVTPTKAKSPSHSIFESGDSDESDLEDEGFDSHSRIPVSQINLALVKNEKFSDDENSQGNRNKFSASTSKEIDLSDFLEADIQSEPIASCSGQQSYSQLGFLKKNMLSEDSLDKDVTEEEQILFYDKDRDDTSKQYDEIDQSENDHNEQDDLTSSDVNNENTESDMSRSSTMANLTKDSGLEESFSFKTSTPKRDIDLPSGQLLKKTRIEKITEEESTSGEASSNSSATQKRYSEADIANLIGSLGDKDLAEKVAASLRNQK